MSKEVDFFRRHLKTPGGVESFIAHMMQRGQQNIHTPFTLCRDMLGKLQECVDISKNKKICVLFNSEFLHTLVNDFGVLASNVFMFADEPVEYEFCKLQYGMKPGVNLFLIDIGESVKSKRLMSDRGECTMKFDVVVGNPPYQPPVKANEDGGGSGSRNTLWDKFVPLSIELAKESGHICLVHPAKWRKPEDALFSIITGHNLKYLEMHSKKDGIRIFGASTPFDWYVLQKSQPTGKTTVKDTLGNISEQDLSTFQFLPNCDFELVDKLLAKNGEAPAEVIFSYNNHETRKPWMSETQDKEHPYKCFHTSGRGGVRWWYSSKKSDHFECPKIIFGEADIVANAVVDFKGEYGITQQGIGLKISSPEEGEKMKKAMESEQFNDFLRTAVRWSQMRMDWRMFKCFKRDFWKEFV